MLQFFFFKLRLPLITLVMMMIMMIMMMMMMTQWGAGQETPGGGDDRGPVWGQSGTSEAEPAATSDRSQGQEGISNASQDIECLLLSIFSVLFYESSYNGFHDVIINMIISIVSPKLYCDHGILRWKTHCPIKSAFTCFKDSKNEILRDIFMFLW